MRVPTLLYVISQAPLLLQPLAVAGQSDEQLLAVSTIRVPWESLVFWQTPSATQPALLVGQSEQEATVSLSPQMPSQLQVLAGGQGQYPVGVHGGGAARVDPAVKSTAAVVAANMSLLTNGTISCSFVGLT
jgi:hypothetical protein